MDEPTSVRRGGWSPGRVAGLAVGALLVCGAVTYLAGWRPRTSGILAASQGAGQTKAEENPVPEDPFPNRIKAVPLEGGVEWLNAAGPIKLEDLRGKVVLLDFWTYCCINCMHVLPVLRQMEEKYPNELVVIGVHSAKFLTEKESVNIRKAILRYGIKHPVVNDANMTIWRNYAANAWPTLRLIDPEGYLVAGHSGEIPFEALDAAVGRLIRFHEAKGTLDRSPLRFELAEYRAAKTPLRFPGKVLADAEGGRLFIADSSHDRIVVATLDGQVQHVIGSGREGHEDGPYDQASFNDPQGMALDGDTLYVADNENHLIRTIDLVEKTVGTLAGTGRQAHFGTGGGPLTLAALSSPWDLLLDGRKLYIAMAGTHQLWLLDLDDEIVAPFAGSGREDVADGRLAVAALAQPSGLATDGEHLWVADSEGSAIRSIGLEPSGEVTTLVGPTGSLFDFGDRDGRRREVRLQHPIGIAYYDGQLYVADTYNHKIKRIDPREQTSKTFLGDGEPGATDDPPRFHEPAGLSAARGKLYIADTNNHLIRVADLESGTVRTLELKGLEPPAPEYSASNSFPNATEIELPPQEVKPGEELTLSVAIQVPDDFKLNPDAPMGYQVDAEEQQGAVDRSVLRKTRRVQPVATQFEVKLPLAKREESDRLKVSVVYYICREGAEGVCKIQSVVWTVPVRLSSSAELDRISLTYPSESP